MCLGIPGEVLSTVEGPLRMGRVAFGQVIKEVCLAYVPEAQPGDFVVVHAGFAISRVDPEGALRVFAYLEELGETAEKLGGQSP
ncbi:HypC/HybG/HupF family hydrogenase formation chaperone [Hyalangium minutum]|uniref:[NiFe] hydrogenase metallocenter assembly protein HypC n=1 Tax=Hyalangium minutum TaxID=394096 RepID=A0A085WHA4_9BACT|nr:HypC/HybG/HupF family hydrogenase formation chaperone [Hyalangium minutum]KFE67067.1 [NiFe] hydrogenase metallocenter assembly protein HypC [Hyalangium minutum]